MAGIAFSAAIAQQAQIQHFVTSQLEELNQLAMSQAEMATDTASGLANLTFDDPDAPPPIPEITFDIEPPEQQGLQEIGSTTFGEITAEVPTAPVLPALPALPAFEFQEFEPTVEFSAPAPVTVSAPDAPVAPEPGEIVTPDAPDLIRPILPELTQIVIPAFAFAPIADFGADLPEFEGATPVTTLQWAEPVYVSEILDEVMTQIRAFWSGDTGLPPVVEQAMWERAASREDLALARQIADVATEFSSRGFTMPPGMQAARADALREDGVVKKLGLNREIAIEVAKIHVENARVAVQQGIAAEQVLANIFLNGTQRTFEAAKYSVQAQLELHGAMVALYNARMNGYGIQAQVYETQLKARLAEIEVFKAQLEGEIAKGTINEQRVKAYTAQIEAMKADVDVYTARMEGAKVQADVERLRIEGYKGQVDAYSALIGAEKLKVDIYSAQVQSEATKASYLDAEARAYAALIQGKTANAEVNIQSSRAQIEAQRVQIESYRANVEGVSATIQAQSAQIDAAAKAFVANTQRYVAEAGAQTEHARLGLSVQETQLRSNLALYESQIQLYTAQTNKAVQEAGLRLEAIKAAAAISSTLSAGAMAALNVGATISGGANLGANGSVNLGQSATENYQYSVSATADGAGEPLNSAGLANQAW